MSWVIVFPATPIDPLALKTLLAAESSTVPSLQVIIALLSVYDPAFAAGINSNSRHAAIVSLAIMHPPDTRY
jgi:hypothetical protein